MSEEPYEYECPLCRPILLDMKTGVKLSDDSPKMQAILKVWGETTLAQRKAWHRITCNKSLDPVDHAEVGLFTKAVQAALTELESRETP